jgi:uncharacterized protein
MKVIDVFCHWLTPRYTDALRRLAGGRFHMLDRAAAMPAMTDLDTRLRTLDRFPGYVQILSLASPPPEAVARADQTPALARIGNDELAALAARLPDRFPGFVAVLPMNDIDAATEEARRALDELGACGVQVFTNIAGHPLDAERLAPLLDVLAERNAPLWLHPWRTIEHADYAGESLSKFDTWWAFGWPYETSAAMARLVFTGVFDRWPALKIITHHLGGVVPMVAGRIGPGLDKLGLRNAPDQSAVVKTSLRERPLDAFKRFYVDTACCGYRPTIECGLAFFGAGKALFASDMPFGPEDGGAYVRNTIDAVGGLDIEASERDSIWSGNARRIIPRLEDI